MKRVFAIAGIVPACLSLTLACATPNSSTVSSGQTNQVQTVVNGEVLAVRSVEIRPETTRVGMVTGAALGGIGGAQIGGGTASNVAGGITGAVVGGMLGSALQRGGQTHSGIEITVKLDSGETIAIVQAGNMNDFAVGNRVRVIGDSDEARVTR
jgi:outer membrane lipoprotein SlyB